MEMTSPAGGTSLTVSDGITTVSRVVEILFSGATVTNGGGGIADVTISGGVTSVSNSNGTLTISPTTGDVIASLNLSHANTWLATQSFTTGLLQAVDVIGSNGHKVVSFFDVSSAVNYVEIANAQTGGGPSSLKINAKGSDSNLNLLVYGKGTGLFGILDPNNNRKALFQTSSLTADRTYTFPDVSGTLAVIPSGNPNDVLFLDSTGSLAEYSGFNFQFQSGPGGTTYHLLQTPNFQLTGEVIPDVSSGDGISPYASVNSSSSSGGNTTDLSSASGGAGADIDWTTGGGGAALNATASSLGGKGGDHNTFLGPGGGAGVVGTGNNTGGLGGIDYLYGGAGGTAAAITSGLNTGGKSGGYNYMPASGGNASGSLTTNQGGDTYGYKIGSGLATGGDADSADQGFGAGPTSIGGNGGEYLTQGDGGGKGMNASGTNTGGNGSRIHSISGAGGNALTVNATGGNAGDHLWESGAPGTGSTTNGNYGAFRMRINSVDYYYLDPSGRIGIGNQMTPTAQMHFAAGSTAAKSAPIKLTSGSLMTSAEVGAIEFLTDNPSITITTGTARKNFVLADTALTSGRVPIETTNGRLTDNSNFTYSTANTRLSPKWITLGAGAAAAGSAPLVFTTGPVLTTAIAGAMEYATPDLFFTPGSAVRYNIPLVTGAITTGDLIYGSAASVYSRLAAVATGQVLISKGTSTAPAWSSIATLSNSILTANAITAVANAATIPVTSGNNIVTNNSAAGLTITLTTAGAVNMQRVTVQVLDFSAAAQTLTLVNTENSTVSAPANTNGSTTLPLTMEFIFNSATTKWRLILSA